MSRTPQEAFETHLEALLDMRCDGNDTFIFEDGQITVQTVKYYVGKAW